VRRAWPSAAWVPVGRDELDPQRLWLAVLDALRQTAPGSALVRPHMRNLYAKLGAHSRVEAVESARALSLLAPSSHWR
jgi:hypothetical protein